MALLEDGDLESGKLLLIEIMSSKRSKSTQIETIVDSVEVQTAIEKREQQTSAEFFGIDKCILCVADTTTRSSQVELEYKEEACGNQLEFVSISVAAVQVTLNKESTTEVPLRLESTQQTFTECSEISSSTCVEFKEVGCTIEDQSVGNLTNQISILNQKVAFHRRSDSAVLPIQKFNIREKLSWYSKAKAIAVTLKALEKNVVKIPNLKAIDKDLFANILENTDIIGKLEVTNNSIRTELNSRVASQPKKMHFIRAQQLPC